MERANALGWRPALDGLRGIAVVCVVLFHFKTRPLLPGGSLGVDLFFALSGFLITAMLVEEWRARGSIAVGRFYVRRALRLLPALVAFLLVVGGIQVLFRDANFTREPSVLNTLQNAGLGLAYVYNWGLALEQVETGAFSHLWSLSIEEQFYLLWPLALIAMLRTGAGPRTVIATTALLAILAASTAAIAGTDSWRRLYYGTDFRMQGLLIGSVAGLLFAYGFVERRTVQHPAFLACVTLAVAYTGALMLFANERAALLYYGGYLAVGVSFAVIVVACAFVDGGLPMLALGNSVIRYLGRRSYAIYLWHFPLAMWFYSFSAWQQLLFAGGLTLVAAELSYRLVEGPAMSLRRRLDARRSEDPDAAIAAVAEALPQAAA